MGIKDPVPTFSACFGEAFLPMKPKVYADLLLSKIKKHNTNVWLINSGWVGGKFGVGKVDLYLYRESVLGIPDRLSIPFTTVVWLKPSMKLCQFSVYSIPSTSRESILRF